MGDDTVTADVRRSGGGLGRGLAALIPTIGEEGSREIPIAEIRSNPFQPRAHLDPSELAALAASVAEHGVLQPVLVTRIPGGYQLIAGERRLRAAELAGQERIPAVVRTVDEQQQLALALVENLQRSDLNAMDEARAFRRLADEFLLTQDAIAARVGRSRSAVANTMRLLDAAPAVQSALEEGRISEGHGRAIASLSTDQGQEALLAIVESRRLSVRRTEALARDSAADGAASSDGGGAAGSNGSPGAPSDPGADDLAAGLRSALSTKVVLRPRRRGGQIIIDYYDADDLARLYDRLTGADR